jgi:uncharacterized membrane protein HdeD (DUF308 family)
MDTERPDTGLHDESRREQPQYEPTRDDESLLGQAQDRDDLGLFGEGQEDRGQYGQARDDQSLFGQAQYDQAGHGQSLHGQLPGSSLGWGAALALGVITLVLGVVLAFRPAQTLVVIAVLLGVVMVVSGIYHIVRALDGHEHERTWRAITGVLFILAGLVLLRHLHLSIALIGLFIGFTWVVQGISSLMESFSERRARGAVTGWTVFFGIISLIAGIVVIVAPVASVGALTVLMGIWFIVMGAMEIIGALVFRHAIKSSERRAAAEGASVPQQRDTGQHPDRGVAEEPRPASHTMPE